MLALRSACWIWAAVIVALILLPRDFGDLDLSSASVQGFSFAVGTVLFALSDRRRPNFFTPRRGGQNLFQYIVVYFKRHLIRIAAMLIFYSLLLGVARYLEVGRSFSFAQLAQNTGWILLTCTVLYILTRIFLVGPHLDQMTQRHLGRVSAAFRCEAAYSAFLRDISQAAYAVCINPSLSAEDRVDRARQLLDRALGAEMPNHDEGLLATAFGARTARSAFYRPSVDHPPPALSREKTT
jgi:hypothetical protein